MSNAGFGSERTGADLEQLCADTLRVLAMDGVEKAGCGHPGMPMGMADAAHLVWSEFLRLDPQDPKWIARDRFVLSAGHGSMLLYGLLHLSGFPLTLDDLKDFRQLGSKTPGHPENFETVGVETTTGPLGQGISNGVGMALAAAHLGARFPEAAELFRHRTYVIAGDGDLMEGVASEACSLAGHLRLRDLVVLWDDNEITIDGATDLSFGEDVLARFKAYGWSTERVDGHDPAALREALQRAQTSESPSLIACKTTIGKGSPNKAGTSGVHGSKLGADELKLTKDALGWPQEAFLIPDAVKARWQARREAWSAARAEWSAAWEALAATSEAPKTLASWFEGGIDLSTVSWPEFEAGKSIATRASSGKVLNALAAQVPNLVGGSADLTGSNKTHIDGSPIFSANDYAGRNLRFGVREHAMGSIMNGMALHGALIPYGGTFMVFSDYCRPAMRLSALMGTRVVYVMTHDSVFLGEDGPTHQPVEHVASLRAIPGMRVFRPGDANEVAECWRLSLELEGPSTLSLTRQGLPTLDRSVYASAKGCAQGAYTLWESGGAPELILLATGSEVQLALDVAHQLASEDKLAVRVVSVPCWELFFEQDEAVRESVLPAACGARVSIEAGVTFGWQSLTGSCGLALGIDRFGASAPDTDLAELFGLTPAKVSARVRRYLQDCTLTA